MTSNTQRLIYLAVFLTSLACVYTQQTYEISPNGTLILDPPPPQTNNSLLSFSNPSYLNFIYSSTDGISNGISSGISPILDAALTTGNSTCIINDPTGFVDSQSEDSSNITTWLIGIVILAVIGMLMCVCVLVSCCIVCCCRVFCANCGAERSQKISPKCTLINLCVWSPILLGILIMAIFGCIFGVLSYFSLNTYVSNVPTIYDNSINFINQTLLGLESQVQFTIQTQLDATFDATIQQIQGQFDTSFGDRLDGLVVELSSSVDVIDQLKTAANNLQSDLNNATTLINSLNTAASDISTDLMNLRSECTSAGMSCNQVPASISTGLTTAIVPDISAAVTQLNSLNTSDLTDVVQNITTRVDEEINSVRAMFNNTDVLSSFDLGSTFSQIASSIDVSAYSFDNILILLGQDPSSVIQTYNTISTVVLVVVIIVFVLIIITVLFALLGLVVAFFGYDSEAKASMRSGLSNSGAKLLALSGYVSLFMTWFLIPVLVIIFTLGSILTTLCQPLVDQSILDYISPCVANVAPQIEAGQFGNFTLQINISYIFEACQNGESILSALQADELADNIIMDVTNLLNNEVGNLTNQINPDVISQGIITSYQDAIDMYDTSDYDFNAANSLITDLDTAMVTQSINDARTPIMTLIAQIDASPSPGSLSSLRTTAVALLLRLDSIETNLVPVADGIIASTTSNVNNLTAGLNEVNNTLTMAFATVTQFAANLTTLTNGLINSSVATLQGNALSYLLYVRDNIPECRFLTDFYTAIVDVICLGVLRNFNALWFCLGWALIFLLLSGIFSFIVARYAVRREHESWFQEDDQRDLSIPPGADQLVPNVVPNVPVWDQPTAPDVHGYLDSGVDQPPPKYMYANQNIEMQQPYPTNTPVLTQMRGGEQPQQAAW